jgi:hypothetical protein
MNKKTLIAILTALGLLLIGIFYQGLYRKEPEFKQQTVVETPSPIPNPDEIMLVSTQPDLSQEPTISSLQPISLTFSYPLTFDPEKGRIKFEPEVDFKSELTNESKTLVVTPLEPFESGQNYTLHLTSELKFDKGKKLGKDIDLRFRVIKHSGL